MTTDRDPMAAVAAASTLWGEPERAEALLLQAMADAPNSLDVLVALYRFYLFALNAYGYLLARLGRKEEAEQALSAVMRLDPHDRIGSGQLLGMVRAGPTED